LGEIPAFVLVMMLTMFLGCTDSDSLTDEHTRIQNTLVRF